MYLIFAFGSGQTHHQVAAHAREALVLLQSEQLVGCDVSVIGLNIHEASIDDLLTAADREANAPSVGRRSRLGDN